MQVYVIIQTIYSDEEQQSIIHSIWENELEAHNFCVQLNDYYDIEKLAISSDMYLIIWNDISDDFFKVYEDWSGEEDEVFKGKLAQSIVENKYHLSFEDWLNAYEVYSMNEQGEFSRFHIEKYEVL